MSQLQFELKQVPVIKRALGKMARRRTVFVQYAESVRCSGTFWDGGSRSSYHHLSPAGALESVEYPLAPPQHGGGPAPEVRVKPGWAIVQLGTSCGKPAFPTLYVRPMDCEVWGIPPPPFPAELEPIVAKYRAQGFTEDKRFPGEYLLMLNPANLVHVRVYENGKVWVRSEETGEYAEVQP